MNRLFTGALTFAFLLAFSAQAVDPKLKRSTSAPALTTKSGGSGSGLKKSASSPELKSKATPDPKTNVEIRKWYKAQDAKIPGIVASMKKAGKSMEECARSAWQLRRDNRLKSRDFMRNAGSGSDVDLLEARDLKKYGDKNGPSFDYLVKKGLEESGKKAADDEIYQAIVASANRTNKWVNAWNTAVDYCSWAWNGFQAETKQCQLTHK